MLDLFHYYKETNVCLPSAINCVALNIFQVTSQICNDLSKQLTLTTKNFLHQTSVQAVLLNKKIIIIKLANKFLLFFIKSKCQLPYLPKHYNGPYLSRQHTAYHFTPYSSRINVNITLYARSDLPTVCSLSCIA